MQQHYPLPQGPITTYYCQKCSTGYHHDQSFIHNQYMCPYASGRQLYIAPNGEASQLSPAC